MNVMQLGMYVCMDVYCVVLYWNGAQCNAMLYACTYVHLYVYMYLYIYIYLYLHMCNISIIFIQIMSFLSTHMHAYISHTHTNRVEDWKDKLMNSAKDVKSCGQYTC